MINSLQVPVGSGDLVAVNTLSMLRSVGKIRTYIILPVYYREFSCLNRYPLSLQIIKMPTWNQIQSQLKSTNNPVVFLDISVGNAVRLNNIFGVALANIISFEYL